MECYSEVMKRPLSFILSCSAIAVAYAALVSSYAIFKATSVHRGGDRQKGWYALEYGNNQGTVLNSVWQEVAQLVSASCGDLTDSIVITTPGSGSVTFGNTLLASGYVEVGGDVFSLFNIGLSRGRLMDQAEYGSAAPVALVSEELEHRAQSDILGKTISVNRRSFTIVGVFKKNAVTPLLVQADVYVAQQKHANGATPWTPSYNIFVHPRPDIPAPAIEDRLKKGESALGEMARMAFRDFRPRLKPVSDLDEVKTPRQFLYIAASGILIFLVGLANVSGLMIVNAISIEQELKIRAALGANIRHLYWAAGRLSSTVTAAGTALGMYLVYLVLPIFAAACGLGWADNLNLFKAVVLQPGFVVVSLLLVVAIWSVLTVVPVRYALRLAREGNILVASRAVGTSRGLRLLQDVYASAQMVGTVAIISFCFLFFQNAQRFRNEDVGFAKSQRQRVLLDWGDAAGMARQDKQRRLLAVQDALKALPEVRAVGLGSDGLLSGYDSASVQINGLDGASVQLAVEYASADYLEASGMRLLAGRWLDERAGGQVVVNNAYVRRFLPPEQNPIGSHLRPINGGDGNQGWEVVGVVADVRSTVKSPAHPKVYRASVTDWGMINTISVRHDGHLPAALLGRVIEKTDADLTIIDISSFENLVERQIVFETTITRILAAFGMAGILVTLLGSIALLAQRIAFSRTEYGLRLALGASPFFLVRRFVFRNFVHLLAGSGIGLGVVYLALLGITPDVLSVTSGDQWAMAMMTLGFSVFSLVSCLPAVASILRIHPAELLRSA